VLLATLRTFEWWPANLPLPPAIQTNANLRPVFADHPIDRKTAGINLSQVSAKCRFPAQGESLEIYEFSLNELVDVARHNDHSVVEKVWSTAARISRAVDNVAGRTSCHDLPTDMECS